jgi:hypothetical protein
MIARIAPERSNHMGSRGYKKEFERNKNVTVSHAEADPDVGWREREIGSTYRDRVINIWLLICYGRAVWLYIQEQPPLNPRVWSMPVDEYNRQYGQSLEYHPLAPDFIDECPIPALKGE